MIQFYSRTYLAEGEPKKSYLRFSPTIQHIYLCHVLLEEVNLLMGVNLVDVFIMLNFVPFWHGHVHTP